MLKEIGKVSLLKYLQIPNFPNRNELEPLDNWLRSLSEESREDPNISDVHVLLALKWPVAGDIYYK